MVKRNLTSGDGKTERVWKIKLWNQPQALELLGRHQGLFREDPPSDAPDVPLLPPLLVSHSQSSATELSAQSSVLFDQIGEDVLLLVIQPTRERG